MDFFGHEMPVIALSINGTGACRHGLAGVTEMVKIVRAGTASQRSAATLRFREVQDF